MALRFFLINSISAFSLEIALISSLVVPDGYLFMLGDNRYDSKDGRYWGLVPRENVRGRPVFVYYSYRSGESDRPLPFLTDIRWGRIGTIIR